MKKLSLTGFTGLFVVSLLCSQAHMSSAALDPSDPMTWLLKSVCVDGSDHVVAGDPYRAPSGTSIRKIRVGEGLPYHNVDQKGQQQHDAFPIHDLNGNIIVVAPFDFPPFNVFNRYNRTDGYDLFAVQGDYATIVGTSDGGGYGQTFFSSRGTVGGGWDLFPSHGFMNPGKATVPIGGSYWEQNGEPFPGKVPAIFANRTMFSWRFQPKFAFGGIDGNPVKVMDTVISYHGYKPNPDYAAQGHMEVFYFTKEYGITRWETWIPVEQGPSVTTDAVVEQGRVNYNGMDFVVAHARDWSKVTMASTAQIPVWPIPHVNMLQHGHFDAEFTSAWERDGAINWASRSSSADRDVKHGTGGVRYLEISSSGASDAAGAPQIYQDLSASRFSGGKTYGFGAEVRTASGQGRGSIAVTVQQLDGKGSVLWSDRAQSEVASDNGNSPSPGEAESVFLSTIFVHKTTRITLVPGAAKVRFCVTPLTSQTFDVLNTWFAPWPVAARPE